MEKARKNVVDYLIDIVDYSIKNPTKVIFIVAVTYGIFLRLKNFLYYPYITHPDEIFQSLEPAHKLVYGYANLPPEFLDKSPDSEYYAKSRSWMFPLFFAIPMFLMDRFGFDYFTVILPSMYFIGTISSILLIFSSWRYMKTLTGNSDIANVASSIIAITPHVSYLSSRLLTNSIPLPLLLYALSKSILIYRERRHPTKGEFLIIMMGMGVMTYIRIDLLIIIVFTALAEIIFPSIESQEISSYETLRKIVEPGIAGWIFGMLVDFQLYDGEELSDFWQVPYNWFQFNFIEGGSKSFGVSGFGFYYSSVLRKDLSSLWIWVGVITIIFTLVTIRIFRDNIDPLIQFKISKFKHWLENYLKISFTIFCSWIIYEWPFENGINFAVESHKEIRFILNVLVLYRLYIGYTIIFLLELIDFTVSFFQFRRTEVKISRIGLKGFYLKVMVLLLILMISNSMVNLNDEINVNYKVFADTNKALSWVGQQENTTGVIILLNWYYTGGYTYFHVNKTMRIINWNSPTSYVSYIFSQSDTNFAVIPKYSYTIYPSLPHILRESDWGIIKVFDTKTEVWIRNSSSF